MGRGTALHCWITLVGNGRGRVLGWVWRKGGMPFLGRHRVKNACCMLPFLIFYAYPHLSDFPSIKLFLSYVTPPSLISFSYAYYHHYKIIYLWCVKSSSLYNFFFQYFVFSFSLKSHAVKSTIFSCCDIGSAV